MFAGMIRVENKPTLHTNDNKRHQCAVRSDGVSVSLESDSRHRRTKKRPGHMRTEQLRAAEIPNSDPSTTSTGPKTSELPSSPCEKWLEEVFDRESSLNKQTSSKTQCPHNLKKTRTSGDVFNSSFSFIQESLETNNLLATITSDASPSQCVNKRSESMDQPKSETPTSGTLKPDAVLVDVSMFEDDLLSQSKISPVPISQSGPEDFTLGQLPCSLHSEKQKGLLLDRDLWQVDLPWLHRDMQISTSRLLDMSVQDSDTEVTSSLSVDSSDSTSASSVTSGYESTTASSEQSHSDLVKRHEDVLQHCLQNTRTNTKMESMMLKLQRLQHRAVLQDDYDAAERFGKKLEDLQGERATLKPGLPSRHPTISSYLDQLKAAVSSALQRTDTQCRQTDELSQDKRQTDIRRDSLIQEKQRIQKEMRELQRRLEELQEQSKALEIQLVQENKSLEPVLRCCDAAQLQLLGQALENMISSKHRAQISVSPPAEIIRLQEQEIAVSLSIKEATAKVVMSQKLSSRLRRKVSQTETQLLALHEAKLAAVSGSDFRSAKELKVEIRRVYRERDRLEALDRKLHALQTGSGRELTRMKELHKRIKQDLQQREAQYKSSLTENTQLYLQLLEEQRHRCGSPALEHIWEADLEACHLLLKGLELRTPSLSETEDLPPVSESSSNGPSFPREQADCAMLTALGGRWCPEADLQHSEFTKKLEEFLFCLEDSPAEGLFGDAEDLTERCELISQRLHHLEHQLQTAIENHDKDLTLSLEEEVLEVKSTLHAMLAQLKHEDEEDEEKYCDVEERVEDIEELYFSDSWEI